MQEKVKIGIIGLGNIGTTHARNIREGKCPECELVAICDLKEERLRWAKENLGDDILFFKDAEEMMDSGKIQAVMVCIPHYFHPVYAIKAMQRGLHVMVEKPAGVYGKQVLEMNAEADRHPELKFGVMFNQRTNCIYRKMREIVQSGKYGKIRRSNWLITNWYRSQAYYDSGDWRATWSGEGGGVLLNQSPHQLDMWQWICGMPKKVSAQLHFGLWHDIEVEDDVTCYVEYENGATGVFITSTGDGHGSNRFEIQLDKCTLIAENDTLKVIEYETSVPEFSKTNKEPFGWINTKEIDPELDGLNEQHVGVVNAWAAAILRNEPLVADGREGINGVTLSNAMHLSAFLGRPVELPLDHELYYEELMKRVKTSRRKEIKETVTVDLSGTFGGTK